MSLEAAEPRLLAMVRSGGAVFRNAGENSWAVCASKQGMAMDIVRVLGLVKEAADRAGVDVVKFAEGLAPPPLKDDAPF